MSIPLILDQTVPPTLAIALRRLAAKSVDGSIDFSIKQKAVNTANSSTISGTASETNFDTTQTILTNMWKRSGSIRLKASGIYSTTGTPTLLFKVKLGTSAFLTFTARTCINNASNVPWILEAVIVPRTLGASGTVSVHGHLIFSETAGSGVIEPLVPINDVTVDMTVQQILQISATWGTSSASNATLIKNFMVFLNDYV